MKTIWQVKYVIKDRGVTYAEKQSEVVVSKGNTVMLTLKSSLEEDAYAMDLSPTFAVFIKYKYQIGYS